MKRLLAFLSRISVRLLVFNVLVAFLPVAGMLYLNIYERQLLKSLEHALVQQGRVLAAALVREGAFQPAEAERILVQLRQRHEARLRVVDAQGRLLADSSLLGPQREGQPEEGPAQAEVRQSLLYRIALGPVGLYRRLLRPPQPPLDSGEYYLNTDRLLGPEVREALAGRYGAATRISTGGQRSVTLYSAIPVRVGAEVAGAVLVSQSTYRILRDLYELRLGIFRVFLLSVGAAVVISLLLSTTIAGPVQALRRQAVAMLDRRGRLTGRFRLSRRRDEIGELSRALEELTGKLDSHLRSAEAFAADLSHEFRNPLATIRTATELIGGEGSAADRRAFVDLIQREVSRMQHLLSAVRDISRIDADLDREERRPVDLAGLARAVAESRRLRGQPVGVRLRVTAPQDRELVVLAAPERLAQVMDNLLDNALSFAPRDTTVEVECRRLRGRALVEVLDRGPGVAPEHRERVFERFFSFRPPGGGAAQGDSASADGGGAADGGEAAQEDSAAQGDSASADGGEAAQEDSAAQGDSASADGGGAAQGSAAAPEVSETGGADEHAGLGLAIVKAVVEGYGGSVSVSARRGGGCRFAVDLPLAERSE